MVHWEVSFVTVITFQISKTSVFTGALLQSLAQEYQKLTGSTVIQDNGPCAPIWRWIHALWYIHSINSDFEERLSLSLISEWHFVFMYPLSNTCFCNFLITHIFYGRASIKHIAPIQPTLSPLIIHWAQISPPSCLLSWKTNTRLTPKRSLNHKQNAPSTFDSSRAGFLI